MREELPLLELFTRLREAGLPLGLDDYQAVVKSLQRGYGVADRSALARLCRTLWVRSEDEGQLFDYYFGKSFVSPNLEITDEKEIREILSHVTTTNPKKVRLQKLITWEVTNSIFRILSYAALILGLGLGLSMAYFHFLELKQTTVPKTVLDIFKNTRATPKSTPIPTPITTLAPTPTPLKPLDLKLPRTADQEQQIQTWKQKNRAFSEGLQMQWILIAILIMIAIGTGSIWLIRTFFQRLPKPVSPLPPEAIPQRSPQKTRKSQPQALSEVRDEVQVAQTIRQAEIVGQDHARKADRTSDRTSVLTSDYLPVTQRQMKQSWRYLRQFIREGVPTELDVELTVRHIAQNGMLLNPVLIPPRRNKTALSLLIDQDGSMVAFHRLSVRLAETAEAGRLGDSGVCYFHNCPIDYLYHDPHHQQAIPIQNWLEPLSHSRSVILIFSDAGAARGSLNLQRIQETEAFLKVLKQQVRHVAWLNPMPKKRWVGTSAETIAQWVPMFEMSRQGMDGAISALRGQGRGR
jgi:uncharacterized protein